MKLVIKRPELNEKGMLKRIRQSVLFNEVLINPNDHTLEEIDDAYDWLLSIIIEPEDREEAYNLLMELTFEQLTELFTAATIDLEPDPKSQENSEDG